MSMDNPNIQNTLTDEQAKVLIDKGTEIPFSGKYVHTTDAGMYTCVACGNELFSSETKFDSGSGWPSFYDVAHSDAVRLEVDATHGMQRTEVLCKKCNGHLGHVFDDGPSEKQVNGTVLIQLHWI